MTVLKYIKSLGGRDKSFNCKFKKDLAGDCVIRSVAIATGIPYIQVWNDLFDIGKKMGYLPNDEKVYGSYLVKNGFTKFKTMKNMHGKKYRVKNFPARPDTAYVLHTSGHATCIVDATVHDLWDCRGYCAYSGWMKGGK